MTVPTPAMRRAMAEAVVGDDVFGEDPTVAELERDGAEVLGKPAALYVPSGTMANQLAIHVHCRPGDELICEERSHVFLYEGGGAARLSGTQLRMLTAVSGFPTPEQVAAAVRSADVHHPRSRLLIIENSHNMAGGRVLDAAGMTALAAVATQHEMAVHIDGARLMNAAIATGCSAAELAAPADSTTLCLSKGLGAPIGSLLAGSETFITEARRARKAFGGGMRQAGVIAAAGLLALHEGPKLLAADHARARRLAEGLQRFAWASIDLDAVETNIVMVDLERGRATELCQHLQASGVRAAAYGPLRARFVTHRDVGENDVDRCLEACSRFDPAATDRTTSNS